MWYWVLNQDNVYFLTKVDEKDLMRFTLSDTTTLPDVDTVYTNRRWQWRADRNTDARTRSGNQWAKKQEKRKRVQMPEDKAGVGTYLIIGLIAAGAGAGAQFYMRESIKPRNMNLMMTRNIQCTRKLRSMKRIGTGLRETKPVWRAVLERMKKRRMKTEN